MSLHVHVHVYVNQSNNPHHADKRPRLDQLHKQVNIGGGSGVMEPTKLCQSERQTMEKMKYSEETKNMLLEQA